MRRAATVRFAILLVAGASLAACATVHPQYAATQPVRHHTRPQGTPGYKVGQPYQVGGIWYVPKEQPNYNETGVASWYGDAFHLKPTANGEIFDKDIPSAAHTTLPLPSLVEVTNLDNGKKLVVRVNDRGPFVDNRIIDLSHEAARELGYDRKGLAHVRVRYLGPAPLYGEDSRRYAYLAPKPAPAASAPPPRKAEQEVMLTSAPLPKPPAMIVEASLAPPPKARALREAATPMATGGFRVQVGAFATAENAQRAAARLASAGRARIEPMDRSGTTLYRLVLDASPDRDAAEELRDRVAEAGFADARVLKP